MAPSGSLEGKQPFHIPGHGHKAPFPAHIVQPAQQKLAESQHGLDDMAGMSLDAEVDLDFPPAGLTWWLRCPAENVLKGVDPAPAAGRARQGRRFGERVDGVRCRKSSEPFSGTSRTGLRRTKTEIGKWRAETAAVKPAAGEPKFEDCWPETSA